LFHIQAIIGATITQLGPNIFVCFSQQGVYPVFISYYSLIETILVISLMTIRGLWALMNIRSISRIRVVTDLSVSSSGVTGNTNPNSSKDRQLIFMLLMNIIIFTLFSSMLAIYYMDEQIT